MQSSNITTYTADLTDTFKEVYTRIRRVQFSLPSSSDHATVVLAAKKSLGLREDSRTRSVYHGKDIELRFPRAAYLVAYVHAAE
jgi:hypothetical protein